MKKMNTVLNIVMGGFAGVFLGRGLFVIWNFRTHPDLYAMQSAPWYTSILVEGALTLVVLLACMGIKAVIAHQKNKKE